MKKSLTLSLLLFLCLSLTAQTLPRKGSFGVQMSNREEGAGLLIDAVIGEQSTAAKMGVQEGDVLVSINEVAYEEVGELVKAIGNWEQGDPLIVQVERKGKSKTLKGEVVGKPLETSESAEVIYGAVPYADGLLRSILEVPKGVDNPPVVFFLPGIGCGTLEFYYNPEHPLKQLVEGLVEEGFAVYRVEKPGMGDSQNPIGCYDMELQYEVDAFTTALRHLKTLPQIDAENVFLYGHSLGGVTGPLIAAAEPVKGVVCWGSISTSWFEYELNRCRFQGKHFGRDYEESETLYRERLPFLYDFLVLKKTPEELQKVEAYKEVCELYFEPGSDLVLGLHQYKYIQALNDVNFANAWKSASCNVLALFGENDAASIDQNWAMHTAEMVNFYHPGKGSWQTIPQTTHGYLLPETVPPTNRFNEQVPQTVAEWIRAVLES